MPTYVWAGKDVFLHVFTHLLAGSALAQSARLTRRDRAWITWASVVPDLDGAGLLVDGYHRVLGLPETAYYETWHHVLGHGGSAALLMSFLGYAFARERAKTAALVLCSFHLHLLCDLLGSRGSSAIDIWSIPYLAPFAMHPALAWSGQWPLTSWQNTSITILLLIFTFVMALRRGYSPLELFSTRADAAFVATLRRRFSVRRAS